MRRYFGVSPASSPPEPRPGPARRGPPCSPTAFGSPAPVCDRPLPSGRAAGSSIDPLGLYAAGIDASDYVARVAPHVRRLVQTTGDLLDIGAGAGQLGRALREAGARWTAIEPAAVMRARLAALEDAPAVLACDWQDADIAEKSCDTVLAANMPAPLTAAAAFLDRCRAVARRTVVWIVPAQHGPRGLCLAGCLPADWHGEDLTPGLDIVLAGLGAARQPEAIERIPWTFALPVGDLDPIARHLADRLGYAADDPRRPAMREHLAGQVTHGPDGPRLAVEKISAVLVWRLA